MKVNWLWIIVLTVGVVLALNMDIIQRLGTNGVLDPPKSGYELRLERIEKYGPVDTSQPLYKRYQQADKLWFNPKWQYWQIAYPDFYENWKDRTSLQIGNEPPASHYYAVISSAPIGYWPRWYGYGGTVTEADVYSFFNFPSPRAVYENWGEVYTQNLAELISEGRYP